VKSCVNLYTAFSTTYIHRHVNDLSVSPINLFMDARIKSTAGTVPKRFLRQNTTELFVAAEQTATRIPYNRKKKENFFEKTSLNKRHVQKTK
jgi:hypothetical protein